MVKPGGITPTTVRGRPLAVSVDAEHVAPPAEPRLPELVAEHDDAVVALEILVGCVGAPDRRLHAERGEHIGRADHARQLPPADR